MRRMTTLERIEIPQEARTVKDWFTSRESANAVLPAIRAHIQTTGETHTCCCHTHTKPPRDSVPVYIGEFSIPEKYRKAKRFCPCPVCWDEFGKFGQGKIAWFPDEKVIRLIGDDCFKSLNPEGHEAAQRNWDIEQERKRNTDFLLSNISKLPHVVSIIERGIPIARAVEKFHEVLHNRLRMAGLNLWPYVRRGGDLPINIREQEFRQNGAGEMYIHEVETTRTFAVLQAYEMLDPTKPRLSEPLQKSLERIKPYLFGGNSESIIAAMSDDVRRGAADALSRAVKLVKEKLAETDHLRRFSERVTVNTLRAWGAHEGCPVPYNYSHDGSHIRFGRNDYEMVGLPIFEEMNGGVGTVEFWTEMEPKGRR
jgi:hypothetical protein